MSFTDSIRRGAPGALLIGMTSGLLAGAFFNRRVTVLNDVAAAALAFPASFFALMTTQHAVTQQWAQWRGQIATAAAAFVFFGTCHLFHARPEEVAIMNAMGALVAREILRQARQWGWSVP